MKKTRFSHCQWGLILALSTTMGLTGCRTGGAWKMPGSSMFSSSRTPDAETLAGRNGASHEVPELPESPAAKYSPDSIASVGNRSSSPSDSSTSQKSTSAYGFPAQTVATPKTGLAASANGYQTGPYPVGGANANSSAGTTTQPSPGYPNPYGGTYSGNTAADVSLPNAVKDAMAGASQAMPSYPSVNGTSTPTYSGSGGYGPQASGTPSSATPGASTYPGVTSSDPLYPSASYSPSAGYGSPANGGTTQNPSAATAAPTGGQNSLASYPANSASLPAYPTLPQMPAGSNKQGQPASSAYQGSSTLPGGYTPGTTARPTSYDFSPQGSSGAGASKTGTSGTLPPNTATLPSYPSYPSSALTR